MSIASDIAELKNCVETLEATIEDNIRQHAIYQNEINIDLELRRGQFTKLLFIRSETELASSIQELGEYAYENLVDSTSMASNQLQNVALRIQESDHAHLWSHDVADAYTFAVEKLAVYESQNKVFLAEGGAESTDVATRQPGNGPGVGEGSQPLRYKRLHEVASMVSTGAPVDWERNQNSAHERALPRKNAWEPFLKTMNPNNIVKMRGCKVVIVGIGSTGAQISDALARYGFKEIVLVDWNCVQLSDLCHHLFRPKFIGQNRAQSIAASLRMVNPTTNIRSENIDLEMKNGMLQFLTLLIGGNGDGAAPTPGGTETSSSNSLLILTLDAETLRAKVLTICKDLKIPSIVVHMDESALGGRVQYNPPKDISLVNSSKGRTAMTAEEVNKNRSSGGSLTTESKRQHKWSPLASVLAGATVDMVLHYALGRNRNLPKKCINF
jgi:hypothetical protein